MRSFGSIFALEFRALVRSRALLLLALAAVGWMFAFPHLVTSDGTPEGARELYIHYALGGAFALVLVALAATAAGSLAKDRAAKRLQLTTVRPVRYFAVALARAFALTAAGALTLALAAAVLIGTAEPGRRCYHVLAPVMESPRAEAEKMFDIYMNDPETPEEVRKAPKATVLRLLTQRAWDNYQTVAAGETVGWRFNVPDAAGRGDVAVRLRFTNDFDTREDVRGAFRCGELTGVVSNITRAVVVVPLARAADGAGFDGAADEAGADAARGARDELVFSNRGTNTLMLRPRRDINLLYTSGTSAFALNVFFAYLELVAMLALAVAFAMFLSAALGRSVAIFTTMAMLLVTEISPSVIEQYPDSLETDAKDRIGLELTRFVEKVTSPFGSLTPLEHLANGECVEPAETARALAVDFALLPLLLALAAGVILPRKQDGL